MRYQDYYSIYAVRETCHAVKGTYGAEEQKEAIEKIARYFFELDAVSAGDIVIPAPQKTGRTEYTKDIAEKLSEFSGCDVLDILRCSPHAGVYENKRKGKDNVFLDFFLIGDYPRDRRIFFLDNVISTGTTYNAANALFDLDLIPLVYAVDFTRLADEHLLGILDG